jgi:predicted N-acetyltransferase YhbS
VPGAGRIIYRRLLPTDDLEIITALLHEAYAPLAAVGMRLVASHQSALVTRQRMDRGETFVAADGDVIVGVTTLGQPDAARESPLCARPDVADFGQFAVRPAYQGRGIGSRLMDIVEARATRASLRDPLC